MDREAWHGEVGNDSQTNITDPFLAATLTSSWVSPSHQGHEAQADRHGVP